MKILYFHGFESSLPSSKANWMGEQGHTVVSHPMNYEYENSFEIALKFTKFFNPDMIVGSSMGGYFAFRIGTHISTKLVLLNPALAKRTRDYNYPINGEFKPKIWALLGKNDEVVDPRNTTKKLKELNAIITIEDHGHRTPLDAFKDFINKHGLLSLS